MSRCRAHANQGQSTYLHLNVQDTCAALLGNVVDGLDAGAVRVAAKSGVLNEALLLDEVVESLPRHKVVLAAILLAGTRPTGRVGDAEAEPVGVLLKQALEDGRLARLSGTCGALARCDGGGSRWD